MKRPVTRESILKQIDRAYKKIAALEVLAQEQLDMEELYRGCDVVKRNEHAESADKLLAKIKYQKERRLKKLGEKLAEVDTIPLIPEISPSDIALAHQYLYYVKAAPIWSDSEYDLFCKKHNIPGSGGSDIDDSYSESIKALAAEMTSNPGKFPSNC